MVVHQFAKIYEVKEPILKKYFTEVKKWTAKFHQVQVEQIPREANEEVDYLARIASTYSKGSLFFILPILELSQPS